MRKAVSKLWENERVIASDLSLLPNVDYIHMDTEVPSSTGLWPIWKMYGLHLIYWIWNDDSNVRGYRVEDGARENIDSILRLILVVIFYIIKYELM